MARRLGSTPFAELLPGSIAGDATIQAAAASLDQALAPSIRGIPLALLFARLALAGEGELLGPLARLAALSGDLPPLPPLPEDALDSLAWQLHVDGYEAAESYEAKRRMVDRSLLLHRRKGTPWAVAEALRSVGYADARVLEGAGLVRHDGEILHDGAADHALNDRWAIFDVEVDLGGDMGLSVDSARTLRRVVEAWKNARSHLRAFHWRTGMGDELPISDHDGEPWAVDASYADSRPWALPLHDGAILYDSGLRRAHDGRLAHDGTAAHSVWEPRGRLHDVLPDLLAADLETAAEDILRYAPRHDRTLRHDRLGLHGPLNASAADVVESAVSAAMTETVPVRESPAVSVSPCLLDEPWHRHDGLVSHGQRYAGAGGMEEFFGVRHDGRSGYDGNALHRLWGWLPASPHAPLFLYDAPSDRHAAAVAAAWTDDSPIEDDMAALVWRFTLHGGKAAHDGVPGYGGGEAG
jgi:hypothetical protein